MKLMNEVNKTGRAYFTHTRLDDKVVLRMCIAQTHTEEEHIRNAWELICETAGKI